MKTLWETIRRATKEVEDKAESLFYSFEAFVKTAYKSPLWIIMSSAAVVGLGYTVNFYTTSQPECLRSRRAIIRDDSTDSDLKTYEELGTTVTNLSVTWQKFMVHAQNVLDNTRKGDVSIDSLREGHSLMHDARKDATMLRLLVKSANFETLPYGDIQKGFEEELETYEKLIKLMEHYYLDFAKLDDAELKELRKSFYDLYFKQGANGLGMNTRMVALNVAMKNALQQSVTDLREFIYNCKINSNKENLARLGVVFFLLYVTLIGSGIQKFSKIGRKRLMRKRRKSE